MASDRVLKLFIVAAVLATAWYAGRESAPGMAIPVSTVGLAAAYVRAVLGIPVAVGMAAAAVYIPGLAIAAMVVVAVLLVISILVNRALTVGQVLGSSANPGNVGLFTSGGIGGGDGGGAGGGCDGGGVGF